MLKLLDLLLQLLFLLQNLLDFLLKLMLLVLRRILLSQNMLFQTLELSHIMLESCQLLLKQSKQTQLNQLTNVNKQLKCTQTLLTFLSKNVNKQLMTAYLVGKGILLQSCQSGLVLLLQLALL